MEPRVKNGYVIQADCRKSFKDIVNHLKKVHNCKKIAFFSANQTRSKEALERYDAFTAALDYCKLPFYPELVFDGGFTDFKAYDFIADNLKSYKDSNPDIHFTILNPKDSKLFALPIPEYRFSNIIDIVKKYDAYV
jgi:DNA-binding LacI/PurR family transcriptional regulator